MSSIISLKINLSKIDKSKIVEGKKGSYLNLTLAINDEVNQYDQNVSGWHDQSPEEREAKLERIYIANGRVVYTDGNIASVKIEEEVQSTKKGKKSTKAVDDLPF